MLLACCQCLTCRWYVIYRVLTEQPARTVVFARNSDGHVYIIPPSGPIRTIALASLTSLRRMPGLGDATLVIADSVVPPALPFYTLVTASPTCLAATDRAIANEYDSAWLRMPVPTVEEVWALKRAASPELPDVDVAGRLALWGSVPRSVLVEVGAPNQRALWAGVHRLPMAALVNGHVRDSSGVAHHIVLELAAGQNALEGSPEADPRNEYFYGRGTAVIASPSMLLHVVETISFERAWDVACLVKATLECPWSGRFFDPLVLSRLASGCELLCRQRLQRGGIGGVGTDAGSGAAAGTLMAAELAKSGVKQPADMLP